MDNKSDTRNGKVNKTEFVYELIFPEELNLKPAIRRDRSKKKSKKNDTKIDELKAVAPITENRTRSGRLVKDPKYLEKYFGEAEFSKRVELPKDQESNGKKPKLDNQTLEQHSLKRRPSAQYCCPKCKKAYLGKTKMMEHIKKYPDHGPLPVSQNELNFEVWNYLVDITQKCHPASRGNKFCEELTNLLHNVQLLTSALFKKAEFGKNYVEVDKVLGNAIGLTPGLYKFNDAELYKDVTVLKLITNTDFFKPVANQSSKLADLSNVVDSSTRNSYTELCCDNVHSEINQVTTNDNGNSETEVMINITQETDETVSFTLTCDNAVLPDNSLLDGPHINNLNLMIYTLESGKHTLMPENSSKKVDPVTETEKSDSVHNVLLTENSLLGLPNLRNSVDELLLPNVDTSGGLLDHSTSSDEVMNVDQFVNERFKNFTEPDIDHTLNLDLPSLDLFSFHNG